MSSLQDQVAANVLEAQRLTRKFFVTELDFSDRSADELEMQVDAVGYSLKGGKSEENIQLLKRVWGTYVGELVRRKLGGDWVIESDPSGQERWAVTSADGSVYPCELVEKRLRGDANANLSKFCRNPLGS